MNIRFHKLSDQTHVLEIARADGSRDSVTCETRSLLVHDLLHLAVESEAALATGFWGNLARGKTLADLNDRTGQAMQAEQPQMGVIEQVVGMMSDAVKGRTAAQMVTALDRYAHSAGQVLPAWLTEAFVAAVQERMRRLLGHWKATHAGSAMECTWPMADAK